MAKKPLASGPSRSTKRRRRFWSWPMTRTGVCGPAIGSAARPARQGATVGKAPRKRSKRAGSTSVFRCGAPARAPTRMEKLRASPGEIATLTDPRPPDDARARHPFERRPRAGEQHDVLVVGTRRDDETARCGLGEADLTHADLAQPVEHVGEVGEKEDSPAGEKSVRVPELRHARPLPAGEGLLG